MRRFASRPFGALLSAAAMAAIFAAGGASAQNPAEETSGGLAVDREVTTRGNQPGSGPELMSPEALSRLGSATVPTTTSAAVRSRLLDLTGSGTVVLATWDGGEFTNQDLSATLQLRRPPSAGRGPVEQILRMPADRLRPVVRDLVYELAVYRKAAAEGINEQTPEIAAKLKDYRDSVLNKMVYERNALPLLLASEEKAAREHYEQHKADLYTVPEVLTIRDLHVPIYAPYTVREGDTLASIAEKVAGDPAAVTRILRDDPLHYPRVPLTGVRGPVPIVEVKPGEKLLIPMRSDDVTSAEQVARKIRESLASGSSFDEVQKRFPQAVAAYEGKPFSPDLTGTWPEVRDAVLSPQATTTSQVIRSPWGFDVLQFADREPTRTLSFEEVQEKVFGVIGKQEDRQKKSMEEVRRELFDRMAKKYGLKLNEEALRRKDYGGADPLTGTTPIASASDFTYTLDDFLADLRPTEKSWGNLSYEERLNLVKGAPAVIRYLFHREAEAEGLEKLPAFQKEMQSRGIIEVVAEYLKRKQESLARPTEQQLREYYQQHLDRYTSASRVTLREISKRVGFGGSDAQKNESLAKAKKELAALRSRIQTQADFEQAARRESQSLSTRSRGGLIGTVAADFRGAEFQNQIAQLKPGQVSEPFLYGSEMVIVRLDNREPPSVAPFEEILPQVRRDYLSEVPRKSREQQRDQLLNEVHYQPKI